VDAARVQPTTVTAASAGPVLPRQPHRLLDGDLLETIVMDVWKQQVGRTLRRPEAESRPPDGEFAVSASTTLDAGEPLVVTLRAPARVAAAVATARLDLHEDELAPGDIDDAFTGLLTVVATRLAHAVPDAGQVGPSLVVQGTGLSVMVGGAELDSDVTLMAGSSPVRVSVWRPREATR
jgi:hypothetical protein